MSRVEVPTVGVDSAPAASGARRPGLFRALGTAVARRVVYGLAAAQGGSPRLWRAAHNVVAHPLMEVLPAAWGDALHDWTASKAFIDLDGSASPLPSEHALVGEALAQVWRHVRAETPEEGAAVSVLCAAFPELPVPERAEAGQSLDLDALELVAQDAARHDGGWELETAETSPHLAEDPASSVHVPLEFRSMARLVAGVPQAAFLHVAGAVSAVPDRARHLLAFQPRVVLVLLAELRRLRKEQGGGC